MDDLCGYTRGPKSAKRIAKIFKTNACGDDGGLWQLGGLGCMNA